MGVFDAPWLDLHLPVTDRPLSTLTAIYTFGQTRLSRESSFPPDLANSASNACRLDVILLAPSDSHRIECGAM